MKMINTHNAERSTTLTVYLSPKVSRAAVKERRGSARKEKEQTGRQHTGREVVVRSRCLTLYYTMSVSYFYCFQKSFLNLFLRYLR